WGRTVRPPALPPRPRARRPQALRRRAGPQLAPPAPAPPLRPPRARARAQPLQAPRPPPPRELPLPRSRRVSRCLLPLRSLPQSTLVLDGQDARDLALCQAQPRAVLERAGRRLEAQVEELLTRLGHLLLELLVAELPQLSSSQRDPPPASRTWSSRAI